MHELGQWESSVGGFPRPRVGRTPPTRLLVLASIISLLVASGCSTWRGARLYHSGTQALEEGDVPRALSDLEQAAALVPDASEVHNNLGLAQLSAGQEDRALLSFERATAIDCDNASASENLRNLQARLQREDRSAAIRRISQPPVRNARPDGTGQREEKLSE
jgi:tetratricopeptide (TPR) repeat protein